MRANSRRTPSIDVVIAIHDARRPLDRALASVFADALDDVRVIVVCHGIEPSSIDHLLAGLPRDRIRVIAFADGIHSAAGPFNAGIDASEADYVSVMGSDDFLESGALRAWQQIAAARRPDAVIAEQRHQSGEFIASPLVRPWHSTGLDAVRDRLYYRSAPLGLLRTAYLRQHDLRFAEGFPAGEDVVMSVLLWTHGTVDLARRCPRYVVGADAVTRTTSQPRAFSDVVGGMMTILDDPRIDALPARNKRSLAIQMARIAVIGAIGVRGSDGDWDDEQVAAARRVVEYLERFSPGCLASLSRAERDMLDAAARDPRSAAAAAAHRSTAHPLAVALPRNLLHAVDRESNVRRFAVHLIDRGRSRPRSPGDRAQ